MVAFAASAASRRSFCVADDFVADQHVAHAAADQRFGLADLLAALAHGAGRDLHQRDRRALVRLRMRTQAHAGGPRELGHPLHVALQRVEIDDQRRRVDVVDRRADAGGNDVHRKAVQRNAPRPRRGRGLG